MASREPTINELSDYIASGNNLYVGSYSTDGYMQVYYSYKGSAYYLTDNEANSHSPYSRGGYAVWVQTQNGKGQIVLHSFLSATTIQITTSSSNRNPRVDMGGNVVWERWDGDTWQAYHYDNQSRKISRLTEEPDGALHPDVNGDNVAYAKRRMDGSWETVQLNISNNQREVKAIGDSLTARPVFDNNGQLKAGATKEN